MKKIWGKIFLSQIPPYGAPGILNFEDGEEMKYPNKCILIFNFTDYQLYDKTDMWFICDASDSVSDEDFDYSINFTCSMASQCSIGKTETQCGLSTYYHDHEIEYEFENTTNYEDFETAAQSIEKQDGK